MHTKENIQLAAQKKAAIAEFITERYKSGKVTAWLDIRLEMDVSRGSMPRLIQELQREKLIACIGTALDAGRVDLRATYKVYAPYGTAPLVHVALPREAKPIRYKGERTGPKYWNFNTPELTPENYNLYAAHDLAMLAR